MNSEEDLEILDVVDADDLVVGAVDRREIHREGLFHRSVHVFVLDETGRIYLQRRSWKKEEHPGKWDSSASGHVRSGESYLEAARRELEEEIGVQALPEPVVKIRACEETGREHCVLYRVQRRKSDPGPQPNPEEVIEGCFLQTEQVDHRISQKPEMFTPSFRLLFGRYLEETRRSGG
jgi:isopentenyl-diphosphate delta-isomerase type 1